MSKNKNEINVYDAITNVDEDLIEDAMPEKNSGSKRINRNIIFTLVSLIAVCLIIGVFAGSHFFGSEANEKGVNQSVQSKIYITINPAICLDLSKDGKILEIEALNADGQNLLSDYQYDEKDRIAVAEELIQKSIDSGYLEKGGKVTLSIESENNDDYMKYDSEFKDVVFNNFGRKQDIDIQVRKIITLEKAKEIVLDYCGLKTAWFKGIKCDAGHEEAVYELNFVVDQMEYLCKIDAVSGNILYCEMKPDESIDKDSEEEKKPSPDKETSSAMYEFSSEKPKNITSKQDKQSIEYVSSDDLPVVETTVPMTETTVSEPKAERQLIGEEAAKQIALQHAGAGQVSNLKVSLDKSEKKIVYEIEFYVGNDEYEYEIDAYSGKILEYDLDIHETSSQVAGSMISEEKAKQIALQHAGITQAVFEKVKCDKDDDEIVYEIEFYAGNNEYEYEIDGYTGKIIDYDIDSNDDEITNDSNRNIISESEAKQIALQHAGVSQITFTEVKCERDDGTIVYEIEFYEGNNEYEYEIDGYTGKVLSFDIE
ncbi:MAG: hypothetical protein HFI34_07050 [Lachnospiraceae bacterium]|nr:hypothetical protein [Lachnospiraceae bacterium]